MPYGYGIQICKEVLRWLNSDESFEDKLHYAWSEIDVIEVDDVSPEHFALINNWKKQYLKKERDENMVSVLVDICLDIINHSKKNQARDQE